MGGAAPGAGPHGPAPGEVPREAAGELHGVGRGEAARVLPGSELGARQVRPAAGGARAGSAGGKEQDEGDEQEGAAGAVQAPT